MFISFLILMCCSQIKATTLNPRSNSGFKINYTEIIDNLLKIVNELPDSECKNQILSVGTNIQNGQQGALKMLDATAKPQSGILFGNIMHLGNYDECLEDEVEGKYCNALVEPHPQYGQELKKLLASLLNDFQLKAEESFAEDNFRMAYGFCVPKLCDGPELQNVTNAVENSLESPLHFRFYDIYCTGDKDRKFRSSDIIAIIIFTIVAALCLGSTVWHIFVYSKLKEEERKPNVLVAFSLINNTQKIFATKTTEENLKCLNGLRVISMMWIVLGHGFQNLVFEPHINTQQIFEWKNYTSISFVVAASMGVDTFFTVSGLLVVYLFLKSQSEGVKFSIPKFYLHRLLRLTPSLAMVILLTTTLLKYMGDGPFWIVIQEGLQTTCEKNWWSTLIYLQNYLNPNEQCLGQAWYLAVDTQMYFLSPLFLLPLLKWPKQTISVLAVLVLIICSYVFEITWKKHLGTTYFDEDNDQYNFLISPTHVRGAAYLVGMICGYFVYRTRNNRPLKLSNIQSGILWIASLAIMLAIVLLHSTMMSASEYNVLNSSLFNSLTRVGWSIALSVLILLCVNGYGKPINSFLSSDIFTILIRLNYSVYLLHVNIIALVMAQGRTPTYFSILGGFHQFWGNYIFTLGAAFIWTLAFESAVITIEKLIFRKSNNRSKASSNIQITKK